MTTTQHTMRGQQAEISRSGKIGYRRNVSRVAHTTSTTTSRVPQVRAGFFGANLGIGYTYEPRLVILVTAYGAFGG